MPVLSHNALLSNSKLRVASANSFGLRQRATSIRTMSTSQGSSTVEEPQSTNGEEYKPVGPTPQRFAVADGQLTKVGTAAVGTLLRMGSGVFAAGYSSSFVSDDGASGYSVARYGGRKVMETSKISEFKRPEKPLELYEFDTCPFCKKVREAISILDLETTTYPCPKEGPTWRPKAIAMGGKKQFPYLVDPNSGTAMYESDAIIKYLFETYGDGQVPLALRMGFLTTLTAGLAGAARGGKGGKYRSSKLPEQPLVLWGYEASPFVRLVKETLSELELPHRQIPAARGSPRRDELFAKRGTVQVPYLEDPNTKVYLFESSAIVKYLEDTYAA